ncbi:antibiotic synthesis protein MbtH [Roseateles aquatilis]|uniref:Antibiotic synthesis protein MbtH n=1 Tax=Roseateles aquatilis TaxID=431061 RepID=A0A246JEI8_9BURK|nr:MbtH family NRPS accessory protein [Roseateles aquatilis]OWQ90656.1 antibiotic synthesis protein MbtH [Roseateles aquatilis]
MSDQLYVVVRNHEDQHAIWPRARSLPAGWADVGVQGPKADCLAWIETHWLDMTPASLRDALKGVRA